VNLPQFRAVFLNCGVTLLVAELGAPIRPEHGLNNLYFLENKSYLQKKAPENLISAALFF
jgi:hypothetical protein